MTDLTIGLPWHKFTSANQGVNALSYADAALIDGVVTRLGMTAEYRCIGTRPDVEASPERRKHLAAST